MCRTGDTVHIFALKTAKRKSEIAGFFLVLLIVVVVSMLLNVGSRGGGNLMSLIVCTQGKHEVKRILSCNSIAWLGR